MGVFNHFLKIFLVLSPLILDPDPNRFSLDPDPYQSLPWIPIRNKFCHNLIFAVLRSSHFFWRLWLRKSEVPEPTPAPTRLPRLWLQQGFRAGAAGAGVFSWSRSRYFGPAPLHLEFLFNNSRKFHGT